MQDILGQLKLAALMYLQPASNSAKRSLFKLDTARETREPCGQGQVLGFRMFCFQDVERRGSKNPKLHPEHRDSRGLRVRLEAPKTTLPPPLSESFEVMVGHGAKRDFRLEANIQDTSYSPNPSKQKRPKPQLNPNIFKVPHSQTPPQKNKKKTPKPTNSPAP